MACIIKHYRIRYKLACLYNPVKVTENNEETPAFYVICPFSVHYESVMFMIQAPGCVFATLHFLNLTNGSNKLESLSLRSISSLL